ncbi:MAG: hypothetical protein AAGI68_00605, partial [Planctomycetota bacterium]
RRNLHSLLNPAAVTDAYDINRDKKVDGTDLNLIRRSLTNFQTDVSLIEPPLNPVSELGAEVYSQSEAWLRWKDHSQHEDGYRITAYDASGIEAFTTDIQGDATGFLATGLSAGSDYTFSVTPFLERGDQITEGFSQSVTLTTEETLTSGVGQKYYVVKLNPASVTKGHAGFSATGRLDVDASPDTVAHVQGGRALVQADDERAAIRQAFMGDITVTDYDGVEEVAAYGVNSMFDVGTKSELQSKYDSYGLGGGSSYQIVMEDRNVSASWQEFSDNDYDDFYWDVDIEQVSLDKLTVFSENHWSNQIEGTPGIGTQTLFVELEDGESSVPIGLFPTLTGVELPIESVRYRVSGPGVDETDAFNDSDTSVVDLTTAGATYVVEAGFDMNDNNQLDSGEVLIDAEVVVVQINRLLATEASYAVNNVAATEAKPFEEIFVAKQADGSATVNFDVDGLPLSNEAAEHVLWDMVWPGADNNVLRSGKMSQGDPTVNLGSPQWQHDDVIINLGFDDDGDGTLDHDSEITRRIIARSFSFEIVVGTPTSKDNLTYYPDWHLDDEPTYSRASDYAGHEQVNIQINVEQSNVLLENVIHRVSGIDVPEIKEAETGVDVSSSIGKGTVYEIDSSQGKWAYVAPVESVSNKNPKVLEAELHVTTWGSDRITEDAHGVRIIPIFQYINLFLSKSKAIKYVNDKYDLVDDEVFAGNFNYVTGGTGMGRTVSVFGNAEVEIYDDAFQNENVLASTIGHENEHFRKDETWFLGNNQARAIAEVDAHNWELTNAPITGISASYQALTEHWVRYYRGLDHHPDDPTDWYPNPAP